MIKSSDLSNLDLKEYAETHIQYEYDMLLWSAKLLAFYNPENNRGHIGWTVHNALLNTFSIHARNFVKFLYPGEKNNRHSSDISIENYLDKTTITRLRPQISEALSLVITKANKQVAHLTTERIEYEKKGKGWKFLEIATEIIYILSTVTPAIPDEKISIELKNKISRKIFKSPYIAINLLKNDINLPYGLEIKITSNIEIKIHDYIILKHHRIFIVRRKSKNLIVYLSGFTNLFSTIRTLQKLCTLWMTLG